MAKAIYQKGQKVWVKAVGAWATIEKVLPQWVRGVEEPLKVLYDVGLGREFQASELIAETREDKSVGVETERWRVMRLRNRMSIENADARHPFPGTFPVVVTDELDWGGWRVPAAEYERDPDRIEFQARLLMSAPVLLAAVKELSQYAERCAERSDTPDPALQKAIQVARFALRQVYEPIGGGNGVAQGAAHGA